MNNKREKRLIRVIVNAIGSFFCCSLVLGISMLIFMKGLNLTEEMIRRRALLTFSNIVFLSALFVAQDLLRSWIGEKRYVKRIMEGVDAITKGDFSYRITPFHGYELETPYDEIIEGINRMAAELGSSETMKNDFISNVSHELKTPLSTISAYCEILQDPSLSEEEKSERISMILKSVRELSNLVTNILKLSKLENQGIYKENKWFDLSAQLADALLSYEEKFDEKELEMEANIPDDIIIYADPELLSIVWNNLIGNAVKFTPPKGRVSLSLIVENDNLIVKVSDTGHGIPKDVINHIFDRFFQGDTSHQTEGNGLGLSLVKKVLEIVDGRIEVESKEGQGSTFTVYLINTKRK